MADISFDPAIVSQQRQVIQAKQNEINALMDEAKQTLSRTSSWTGQAADTYRSTFNSVMAKMESAKGVIHSYLAFIDNAVQEYEKQEAANQQDVSSFDGGN